MSIIRRLIEVGMFSKMLAEKSIFRRILPGLICTVALAILTGMMSFIILLGLFYLAYHVMVISNIPSVDAAWIVAVIFISITAILGLLTVRSIRSVRHKLMPTPASLRSVLKSFLTGILH